MEPVRIVTGRAVPLDRSDVDTDQIIPSDWLKRIERTGFGAGLFSEWRDDRDFELNKPEHAVWALVDYGFAVVVSPRFGDIFRNNSTRSGLVPAQVSAQDGRRLLELVAADPTLELTVDVERRTIEVPAAGVSVGFTLDDTARERLLLGLDDIGVTLTHEPEIDAYEAERPAFMPSLRASA